MNNVTGLHNGVKLFRVKYDSEAEEKRSIQITCPL